MFPADDLQRLADLHREGHLSDDEFARAKARVLGAAPASPLPPIATLNQFRRSPSKRWIGGVCGGLEDLTGLAAWGWRILFTLGLLVGGCTLLIYAALWLFVPLGTDEVPAGPLPAAGP